MIQMLLYPVQVCKLLYTFYAIVKGRRRQQLKTKGKSPSSVSVDGGRSTGVNNSGGNSSIEMTSVSTINPLELHLHVKGNVTVSHKSLPKAGDKRKGSPAE